MEIQLWHLVVAVVVPAAVYLLRKRGLLGGVPSLSSASPSTPSPLSLPALSPVIPASASPVLAGFEELMPVLQLLQQVLAARKTADAHSTLQDLAGDALKLFGGGVVPQPQPAAVLAQPQTSTQPAAQTPKA